MLPRAGVAEQKRAVGALWVLLLAGYAAFAVLEVWTGLLDPDPTDLLPAALAVGAVLAGTVAVYAPLPVPARND